MSGAGRAGDERTAVCLCGRKERHLPTTDCTVVVFTDEVDRLAHHLRETLAGGDQVAWDSIARQVWEFGWRPT